MSRAVTNIKHRVNPTPAPFSPANEPAKLLSQYNGRLNTEAGTIEVRAVKPLDPNGKTVGWAGAKPPNS